MKRTYLYILLFFSIISNAQAVDSLFVEANTLYKNDQYTQALQLYKDVENKKVISSALYFNMANAYFKTNQVAPSIYYYEKALQLNPNDEDILFNLDYANRMIIDNIEPLPKSLGQKFRENIVLKLNYNTWATLAVIFALLFAILFLLYHFSNSTSTKRIYFITSIVTAIIVLVNVTLAHQNKKIVQSTKYAIVFAAQTDVRSAPTQTGEINFELHEGTKVKVLETIDNWKKIKLADGNTGWINVEDIREI